MAGKPLVTAAHDAFIGAMHVTALGSAAVALIGAAVVARYLPGGTPEEPAQGSSKDAARPEKELTGS